MITFDGATGSDEIGSGVGVAVDSEPIDGLDARDAIDGAGVVALGAVIGSNTDVLAATGTEGCVAGFADWAAVGVGFAAAGVGVGFAATGVGVGFAATGVGAADGGLTAIDGSVAGLAVIDGSVAGFGVGAVG
jgi:hypothetical protein